MRLVPIIAVTMQKHLTWLLFRIPLQNKVFFPRGGVHLYMSEQVYHISSVATPAFDKRNIYLQGHDDRSDTDTRIYTIDEQRISEERVKAAREAIFLACVKVAGSIHKVKQGEDYREH